MRYIILPIFNLLIRILIILFVLFLKYPTLILFGITYVVLDILWNFKFDSISLCVKEIYNQPFYENTLKQEQEKLRYDGYWQYNSFLDCIKNYKTHITYEK